MQLKLQEDMEDGKAVVNYKPDVNYEPEKPDPHAKPIAQKEEKTLQCRVCKDQALLPRYIKTMKNALSVTRLDPACACSMRNEIMTLLILDVY